MIQTQGAPDLDRDQGGLKMFITQRERERGKTVKEKRAKRKVIGRSEIYILKMEAERFSETVGNLPQNYTTLLPRKTSTHLWKIPMFRSLVFLLKVVEPRIASSMLSAHYIFRHTERVGVAQSV
jgi:hypothetical protein